MCRKTFGCTGFGLPVALRRKKTEKGGQIQYFADGLMDEICVVAALFRLASRRQYKSITQRRKEIARKAINAVSRRGAKLRKKGNLMQCATPTGPSGSCVFGTHPLSLTVARCSYNRLLLNLSNHCHLPSDILGTKSHESHACAVLSFALTGLGILVTTLTQGFPPHNRHLTPAGEALRSTLRCCLSALQACPRRGTYHHRKSIQQIRDATVIHCYWAHQMIVTYFSTINPKPKIIFRRLLST